MTRYEEFPLGPGISISELRDANAECRLHGRCAFDTTPPCGCFPLEKGGPVRELRAGRSGRKNKRAA